jgi:hypothetical protein
MTKKALLVGISNYAERVRSLESPVREIEAWRNLLRTAYGFAEKDIEVLPNEKAGKAAVRRAFTRLFQGAKPDDQLVFLYSGHGVRFAPENGNGRGSGRRREFLDDLEEAILAHPGTATEVRDFAILDDELLQWYADQEVPAGTDVTFIFDCCFGGGINTRDLRASAFMSVSEAPDRRVARPTNAPAKANGRRRLRSRKRDNGFAVPVFVNAAGELNLAVEIKVGDERRSNFGHHAIATLAANPTITYEDLIASIRAPMREFFPQFPNLQGNTSRADNPFLN